MATKKPLKGAARQSAAKRAASSSSRHAGTKAAASPQRIRLQAMLSEAAEQIDVEGLLFLVRQANVLIHNQKVDEVNRELAELERKPGTSRARGSTGGGPSTAGRPSAVAVEVDDSGEPAAVFVTLGTARKVLSREELKRLVRICYAADSKTDALQQLYRVLIRERSDILKDAGIRSPASPLIEGLFYALRRRYHLEDR